MYKLAGKVVPFLEETCGVIALAVMFLAIVVQVIFRYFFRPLIWPFELSIFMYICLIYLGAALAARHDSHVAFDVLFNLLPARVQRMISACLRLLGAALLVSLIPAGIQLMIQTHVIKSASLRIPWSFLVLVYLIGMLLMAGHLIAWIARDWKAQPGHEG
jgi:TRAP-type C4-dicarboxylate transport system permease small subunit